MRNRCANPIKVSSIKQDQCGASSRNASRFVKHCELDQHPAFSNAAGVVTTVVAGGSGTAGLAGSLKSSLSFYANLKAQAKLKVDQMVADLGTARTDDDLEKVQKQVDDYYQWLATQSIPSK